jgi:hypothetical protein
MIFEVIDLWEMPPFAGILILVAIGLSIVIGDLILLLYQAIKKRRASKVISLPIKDDSAKIESNPTEMGHLATELSFLADSESTSS